MMQPVTSAAGSTFMGGVPTKRAVKIEAGPLVELGRRRVLLDPAVPHQHDLVRHGHGLDLVVRDVEHGHAEAPLQGADLAPHLDAQLRVEVRQRLVHEADLRLGDDGAAERDALLLPARELRGLALEELFQAEDAGGALEALVALGRGTSRTLSPKTMFSATERCGNSA